MKLKEQMTCPQRCMAPFRCQAEETIFKSENDGSVIVSVEKPCAPTFLCFKRPEASVYYVKETKVIKKKVRTVKPVNG